MFFTADTSLPFHDITDALMKEFDVRVLGSDVSANVQAYANAGNSEFIKFSNKIKVSNSSHVKSFEDGIR